MSRRNLDVSARSSIPGSVCKPSSVPAERRAAVIYLDQPLPTGSPSPQRRSAVALRDATYPPVLRPKPRAPGPSVTGCLVLQAVGFTLPATSPPPRCALTAPFHHCLIPYGPSAVCFLLHFPWDCSRWPLATTVSCPARTFLPASHEAKRSDRPTGPGIDERSETIDNFKERCSNAGRDYTASGGISPHRL